MFVTVFLCLDLENQLFPWTAEKDFIANEVTSQELPSSLAAI